MITGRSAFIAILSAWLIACGLHLSGILYSLNDDIRDFLFAVNLKTESSDLVIIEIDSLSIKQLPAWPWPRSYHARVIHRLSEAGVAAIAIDLDLSAASSGSEDQMLAEAIKSYSAYHTIFLPVFYQQVLSTASSPEVMTRPHALFLESGAQMASVNVSPDTDGLIRRVGRYPNAALPRMPSMALALAGQTSTAKDSITLDFSIHPNSFSRISFVDVMHGDFDPDLIRGKSVIIGATAAELGDRLAVPLHKALPGVVVQALAYESLQHRPLGTPGLGITLMLLALVSIITVALTRKRSWPVGITMLAGIIMVILLLTLWTFSSFALVVPAYSLVITAILSLAANFIFTIDQQGLTLQRQDKAIRSKEALVNAVFHNSRDPIITLTPDFYISELNAPAAKMIGMSNEQLIGMPILERLPEWDQLNTRSGAPCVETTLLDHQGRAMPVEISRGGVHVGNAEGHILILRDITERVKLQSMLEHAASHDALTNLPNRRALQQVMEEQIHKAAAADSKAAVLLLDLDHFKEINDTLGHATGDHVLQMLGERILECIPENVTAARIGGDEFACVVRGDDAESILESVALRLLENLRTPFQLQDISIHLSASAGISVFPEDAANADELLQHADVAMYRAKLEGKPLRSYDQATNQYCMRRLSIISHLRDAIQSDSLSVFYQPKIDASTLRCMGAEALVRWHHPQLGFISPAEFIPLAEQTGNIDILTHWVLERVIQDIKNQQDTFSQLVVSINLSGKSLSDPECAHGFLEKIRKSGVSVSHFSIEVTESAAMENPERAVQVLEIFRAAGIGVELDDYGTGYSSLSYLQRLPVDVIKLDRSLVQDITHSNTSYTIVHATIDMVHKLGYTLVAEGVEDAQTLELLTAMGCEKIQGFYFSKPLPVTEFRDWLQMQHGPDANLPCIAKSVSA